VTENDRETKMAKRVDESKNQAAASTSRRAFVKKATYVAPAVLSLAVVPAYAKNGSEPGDKEKKDKKDKK
jgi:hypothetical protein